MKTKLLILFVAAAFLLSGCSVVLSHPEQSSTDMNSSSAVEESAAEEESSIAELSGTDATVDEIIKTTKISSDDVFSDRDRDGSYDANKAVQIVLNGASAECTSNAVQIDGSTVTIIDEGCYVISGTLDDGSVVVQADKEDKVQLVLNGAAIHSDSMAAIYVLQADKVFITLADGTKNVLSNGGSFVSPDENNVDAVIFSKDDITLNGSGSLNILSPAGHGVVSKDELTVTGGAYTISSASHGLSANDSIAIASATFSIASGKDGIHADHNEDSALGFVYVESGVIQAETEGDGISASSIVQINGGTFDIITGGGSANAEKKTSEQWGMGGMMPPGGGGMKPPGNGVHKGGRMMSVTLGAVSAETVTTQDSTSIKGIKGVGDVIINGGTFTMDSADDAIHSNANLTVNGGIFEIKSGDDGFHADNAMCVAGGSITVLESYEGIEGLNVEIIDGSVTLYADDDGINAAGGTDESGFGGMRGGDMFASNPDSFIRISGGIISIQAYGDGVDSNGALEISGGSITLCGPTTGDTAVIDYSGTGSISGGTLIGTGSSMMAQSLESTGDQGVIALNVGNQTAGTKLIVTDRSGKEVLSVEPELDYAIALLSCPDLVKGESYTVTIGSASGEFTAK